MTEQVEGKVQRLTKRYHKQGMERSRCNKYTSTIAFALEVLSLLILQTLHFQLTLTEHKGISEERNIPKSEIFHFQTNVTVR